MTTLATPETVLLAMLADPDLTVQWATIPPDPCEWCADVAAVTTVRIYGDARPDCLHPLECVAVCGLCAPVLTNLAVLQRATDAPIVVEVSDG